MNAQTAHKGGAGTSAEKGGGPHQNVGEGATRTRLLASKLGRAHAKEEHPKTSTRPPQAGATSIQTNPWATAADQHFVSS